jgi:hypothetical protein
MIYISERYALAIVIFDLTTIITSLLFRKPKRKPVKSISGPKCTKRLGYYIVTSAIMVLVLGHYAFYMSLANYLEGLLIDAFLFYFGLKVISRE